MSYADKRDHEKAFDSDDAGAEWNLRSDSCHNAELPENLCNCLVVGCKKFFPCTSYRFCLSLTVSCLARFTDCS